MAEAFPGRKLARFTAIFASGTLASRVLGLARDALLARVVPTVSLDVFLVAFRLPNMLREIVGEGAMNAAFVPVFSASHERDPQDAFQRLVANAMGAMLLLLGMITLLGVLLAPMLLQGLNAIAGFTGGEEKPAGQLVFMAAMARWTFPYIFFIGMTVFAMGPLFAVGHYTTPSWSPTLLNIAIITISLIALDWFPDPAYALAAGVWLGGLAQLGVQYLALSRYAGVWRPRFNLRHPGVRTIFLLMGPVVLGQAAGEVNKLVDLLFAASLEEGTVMALHFANLVVVLPLAMFAMGTSVAILPALSAAVARRDFGEYQATLMYGFRQALFLVWPAMIGLYLLREPIIALLFEGRHFQAEHTQRTATALGIYALGLAGFAGVKVAVPGFYAMQDTRTPVMAAAGAMLFNIVLNLVLVRPLGYMGLALSTSAAFTANFAVLYWLLSRWTVPLWDRAYLSALARIVLAGLLMAAVVYAVYVRAVFLFPEPRFLHRLAVVAMSVGSGMLAYPLLCLALGVGELRQTLAGLRR